MHLELGRAAAYARTMMHRGAAKRWRWGSVMLAAAMLSACASDSATRTPGGKTGANVGSPDTPYHWVAAPVRARVYPSTRFVREEGAAVLEARIELLDEMGDSIKGVGNWHFELYAGDHRRDGMVAQRLYAWDVPMMLLDEQRLYYDRITRAYLFRLKMDNVAPSRRVTTFYATLVQPDGTRIEAKQLLQPVER